MTCAIRVRLTSSRCAASAWLARVPVLNELLDVVRQRQLPCQAAGKGARLVVYSRAIHLVRPRIPEPCRVLDPDPAHTITSSASATESTRLRFWSRSLPCAFSNRLSSFHNPRSSTSLSVFVAASVSDTTLVSLPIAMIFPTTNDSSSSAATLLFGHAAAPCFCAVWQT